VNKAHDWTPDNDTTFYCCLLKHTLIIDSLDSKVDYHYSVRYQTSKQ